MTKRRIAILGGGCGGMAAAWGLVNSPAANGLEITIYQLGWRLGGKGASGRNAAVANRIEEHGLHIWGGMYENAFAIMRQVYGQLQRPAGTPLSARFSRMTTPRLPSSTTVRGCPGTSTCRRTPHSPATVGCCQPSTSISTSS
jgi:uncharacterized protein with NAD-binding domain and iron-sulfur cluster